MRVLHVTPYFAPAHRYGGPPQSVRGLLDGLRSNGVDVQVFTTNANGDHDLPSDITKQSEFEGIPVHYFPRSAPRRFFNARGLRRALQETIRRYDLVHTHGLWTAPVWLAVRACLRSGVPFVVSPRGMLDEGSFRHHRVRKEVCYRLWERRYLSRAAFLHATSTQEERALRDRNLGPPVVFLPNGVSPPPMAESSSPRKREGRRVLYLGRLHRTKRLDLLVSAVSRVRRSIPDTRLVLAGPTDGLDVTGLVRTAGFPVDVLGEVAEDAKWDLLASANVVALCSDSESFGISVLEALAVGTPVVVTRTCPWEEVEQEGCGLWVEQGAADIAAALEKVLKDPVAARVMGERGVELVKARYQWSRIGRQMAELYDHALSCASAKSPRQRAEQQWPP